MAAVVHDEVHLMAVALQYSKKSPDPNTEVGACIANKDGNIVGIGYNKMPKGCEIECPWNREAKKPEDTKYLYVCHAVLNAIMNKTSFDVKGFTIYTTLFPCNECAKLIIQSGIKEVVYISNKYKEKTETKISRILLETAGITLRQFENTTELLFLLNSISLPE